MSEPSGVTILGAAGSPSHGRVLLSSALDAIALAVVDTNGDGAFLAEVLLVRGEDGRWSEAAWNSAATLTAGRERGIAYAYGRAPGRKSVHVVFRGDAHEVAVNHEGWWSYLARADEADRLPELTDEPA